MKVSRGPKNVWTAVEEDYLRAHLHESDRKVGTALGRSYWSVASKRHELRRIDGGFGRKGTPVPSLPRGFSAETMAWAVEHNGEHPEAGLILLMASTRDLAAKGVAS